MKLSITQLKRIIKEEVSRSMMKENKYPFNPDWDFPHPGEHIQEYLEEEGVPPEDYASYLNLDQETVDGLLGGTIRIDLELARHLSGVTKTHSGSQTTPDYWLGLQASYDSNGREELLHPGLHLKDLLDEEGVPPEDYANYFELEEEMVNLLLGGLIDIDANIANLISGAFSTWFDKVYSPRYWLKLQEKYDKKTKSRPRR
jgi:plasmid maintenance system antidote protein VapI